jgi:hypothetical protein
LVNFNAQMNTSRDDLVTMKTCLIHGAFSYGVRLNDE